MNCAAYKFLSMTLTSQIYLSYGFEQVSIICCYLDIHIDSDVLNKRHQAIRISTVITNRPMCTKSNLTRFIHHSEEKKRTKYDSKFVRS